MNDPGTPPPRDRFLRARHQIWALGDFQSVATQFLPELGEALVSYCDIRTGMRVLNVGAGAGTATIPAARLGADVTATDQTPEMLDAARVFAERAGLRVRFKAADTEALPFDDGEFDVVLSCLGVTFVNDHQAAADEMTRVCRPGGMLGIASWTPEGFFGQVIEALRSVLYAPHTGRFSPAMWGTSEHVNTLFGARTHRVETEVHSLQTSRFESGEEFREYFKTHVGPAMATYGSVADDPLRIAELDERLTELALLFGAGTPRGMDWEYRLLRARRT